MDERARAASGSCETCPSSVAASVADGLTAELEDNEAEKNDEMAP